MSPTSARRIIVLATWCVLWAWWGVAWTAVEVAQHGGVVDLLGFPWVQVAVAVVITVGAGLTATFGRELTAKYANRPFDAAREYRKDVAVSVILGLGGYAAGLVWRADAPTVALGLIALGWSGTRALSAAAGRLIDMIRRGPAGDEGLPK
jgi:hypothetical protein